MRYRGSTKLKRKHHLIDELERFLRPLEDWPEVSAINPGVITLCRHNDRLKVTIQRLDPSGLRCLARSHGAVQELFLVSSQPEQLRQRLQTHLD